LLVLLRPHPGIAVSQLTTTRGSPAAVGPVFCLMPRLSGR